MNWGRLLDRSMGLMMLGMLVTVVLLPVSEAAMTIAAVVLIGPFLILALSACVIGCLSIIFYGDPDVLFDRIGGKGE